MARPSSSDQPPSGRGDHGAASHWPKRYAALTRGPIAQTAVAGIAEGLCGVAQAGLIAWSLQRTAMGGITLAGVRPFLATLLAAVSLRAGAAWISEAQGAVVATQVKTRLRRQVLDQLHVRVR